MAKQKQKAVPPKPQELTPERTRRLNDTYDALFMAFLDLDALLAGICALSDYDDDNRDGHIQFFAELAKGKLQSVRQAAQQMFDAGKEG